MSDWFDEIKAREAKATPGPWSSFLGSGEHLCTAIGHYTETGNVVMVCDCLPDWMLKNTITPEDHVPNMKFIEEARADIPRLVAEVERLRSLLEEVALQWHGSRHLQQETVEAIEAEVGGE